MMNLPIARALPAFAVIALFLIGVSARAQVEKVVADAKGITWASCAAVMEISLRRLEGVEKIEISMERSQFVVHYKPGSRFQPALLRKAVAQTGVEVLKFQVRVRGKVGKLPSGRILTAGTDTYTLTAESKEVPLATELVITGDITQDGKQPFGLRAKDYKLAGATPAQASSPEHPRKR